MQSDLPHTLLNRKKKGSGGGGGKPTPRADDPAFKKQEEAVRKALERRAAKQRGEVPYTMTEIFK